MTQDKSTPQSTGGWEVKLSHRPATIRAAQAFVAQHHRHNKAPRGARFALEAVYGGDVVGVIIVGRPISRVLDDGMTAEVVRCCVRTDAPKGTNSYLYGAARRVWQCWGGNRVITYTLESEPGDSLRGAGFKETRKTKSEPKGWARRGRARDVLKTDGVRKKVWESARLKAQENGDV